MINDVRKVSIVNATRVFRLGPYEFSNNLHRLVSGNIRIDSTHPPPLVMVSMNQD